jgi:hypothetical protein
MVLVNVVVAVVMLGMCTLLVLDSGPAKGVLYVFARWRHRRRVGPSSRGQHAHALRPTSR